MARGERFELNLDSDHSEDESIPSGPAANFNLVKDIQERKIVPAIPPTPPNPQPSSTGFPAPKIRKAASRFKQQATQRSTAPASAPTVNAQQRSTVPTSERAQIDRDNKEVLARMSEAEIQRERQELLTGGIPGLTPSLIERLLKRSNIEQGSNEMPSKAESDATSPRQDQPDRQTAKLESEQSANVTAEQPEGRFIVAPAHQEPQIDEHDQPLATHEPSAPASNPPTQPPPRAYDPEAPPRIPPPDLQPVSSKRAPSKPTIEDLTALSLGIGISPLPNKTLDPASPSFLEDLHSTYYPNLPSDPSKLSWLQPLPDTPPSASSYSPEQAALPPSALRFDFRGALITPTMAAVLPANLGLHHHADAPESAGYSIGELARLQRSSIPAQRSLAHQTLGRILYRLGRGEFGPEGTELCEGLWGVIGSQGVVTNLVAEAGLGMKTSGGGDREAVRQAQNEDKYQHISAGPEGPAANRTAWALATEAVWLWQRSGGRGGEEYKTR